MISYKQAFLRWVLGGEVGPEPDYYKFGLTFGKSESIRRACYLKALKRAGEQAYKAELDMRSRE